MKLAIQTLLLPGTSLSEKFDYAARCGFDGVEIAVGPDFDLGQHLSQAAQAAKNSGMAICAICTHPIHDPLVPDSADRRRRFEALQELVQQADALGANGVVSVPIRPPVTFPEMVWEKRYEMLKTLAVREFQAWAAALPPGRACVFLEPLNRYEAYFLNRVGQAVEIAQTVGSPRVKVLGDLFHMNIEEADLGDPFQKAGEWLGHVHIADNNRFQPGAGCMDFRPAFAALKSMDYQGFISIECWSPDGPRIAGSPEEALPATVQFMRGIWAAL